MSEIAELYDNARIEPLSEYCKHQCNLLFNDNDCIGCKYIEKIDYPPFTAEKQLELIKWLATTRPVTLNKFIEGWTIEGLARNNRYYDNFENAISGYINSIYPFLNEHQRAEIKEILE